MKPVRASLHDHDPEIVNFNGSLSGPELSPNNELRRPLPSNRGRSAPEVTDRGNGAPMVESILG